MKKDMERQIDEAIKKWIIEKKKQVLVLIEIVLSVYWNRSGRMSLFLFRFYSIHLFIFSFY